MGEINLYCQFKKRDILFNEYEVLNLHHAYLDVLECQTLSYTLVQCNLGPKQIKTGLFAAIVTIMVLEPNPRFIL